MNDWIKELKVGDLVYTIERHKNCPDGLWKWKSTIIAIDECYVETTYSRSWDLKWLNDLANNLAPNHRTFDTQYIKNYFGPDGSINIEKIILE